MELLRLLKIKVQTRFTRKVKRQQQQVYEAANINIFSNNPMDTHTIEQKSIETAHLKDEDISVVIKPAQLSKLLREHGPLAMRHITNLLIQEVPEFNHVSPSKQRRLIMQAMEQGDKEHQVLFEKVGWGLWQIEPIDPHVAFEEQRVLMNNLNKRRMDSTRTSDMLSTSHNNDKKEEVKEENIKGKEKIYNMGTVVKEGGIIIHKQLPKAVFLDENAISSDDEDDEEYKLDARRGSSTLYSIKRRTSSVVNRPDNIIVTPPKSLESPPLLPQKGKPIMKHIRGRRRSSVTANKKKLLLSEKDTSNHSPNPHSEIQSMKMKVTRSGSISKDSGLRTTLHYVTDPIHHGPLSSTSQTSLISSDSLSETHSVIDLPPPVSQLSLASATPERKPQRPEPPLELDQLILSQKASNSNSSQDDNKSDTEEEDWSHMDPQELLRQDQTHENTKEIANLLLSLK